MPGTVVAPVDVPSLKVKIGGIDISKDLNDSLISLEIDNNLYLPDTATLTFILDVMETPLTKLADTNMKDVLNKGNDLVIKDETDEIFNGQIVSVGLEFNSVTPIGGTYLVVQGFDRSHQLHRGRKTETFLQMSISDIAKKVISGAKLQHDVDATTGVLDYIIQSNQTDWEFLWQLADRTGYEIFIEGKKVFFKKPRQSSGPPLELEWGKELTQFRSRKSTAKQNPKVTVRAWDRNTKKAIIGQATAGNGSPSIEDRRSGSDQASAAFGTSNLVIVDYPLSNQSEATKLAQSVSDNLAGEFIQAEGSTSDGNGKILPGVQIKVKGLGSNSGTYLITETTHIQNRSEGHKTSFRVGGRNPLTFLPSYASKNNGVSGLSKVQGIVLGLITNNNDPEALCRVKVEFPWLDEQIETDWAPIATLGAGSLRGVQWLPAVGDQVVVGFEHGDIHRPYVLGSIWSAADLPPSPNNEVMGPDGKVDLVQLKSREGQTLIIDDKSGERSIGMNSPDKKSSIVIRHDEKLIEILSNGDIDISGATGKITVSGKELEVKSSGNLTIEASANIEIKAGANLHMTGGAQATLEGQQASLKGKVQTGVESGGTTVIKGSMVQIN
jgi:phage protein D/phage baseplate assembly protein gpV